MWSIAARLTKRVLVAAGVVVILLAVAVGGARLLLAQLPGYGDRLTAWVADEVGLDVEFERIDVRFNLRGPEISFRRATVAAPGRNEPFLRARRASVTLDPWALAMGRDDFVSRLRLEGTRLTVVRNAEGGFELQEAPLLANSDRLFARLPARIDVVLADTALVYRDALAGVDWRFADVEVGLVREPGHVTVDASASPPRDLGARASLSFEATAAGGDGPVGDWRVVADVRDADLAALGTGFRLGRLPAVEGRGDVALTLESGGQGIASAAVTADVRGFALPGVAPGARWSYDRVAFEAEWTRDARRGWTLGLDDVALTRNGRAWAAGGDSRVRARRFEDGGRQLSVTSDFVRLEDLRPFVRLLPRSDRVERWLDADVRGDLHDVDVSFTRRDGALDYAVSGRFRGLGVDASARFPGFSGLSGEVRADNGSGRIRFRSPSVELEWPAYARGALGLDALDGVVVWRRGRDGLRIVSDDLAFSALGGSARTSLELTLPAGAGSPRADVEASLTRADVTAVKRLVPRGLVPDPVVEWLDTALDGGTARDVELELYGPLDRFPFDDGRGRLRVAADVSDAELEFVEGWPRAVDLDGRVEFVNASFRARGDGRVLGQRTSDLEVAIPDLRDPVLSVDTATAGPLGDVLAFLEGAPLIARELGPELARLRVHAGTGRVQLDLDLPLLEFGAYSLDAALNVADGELSVDGFAPRVRALEGRLDVAGTDVTADSLEAVFLDGPVSISVANAAAAGYRAVLGVDGETSFDAVEREFGLRLADRIDGRTSWHGELWLPAQRADARAPVRVTVASSLAGLASRYPPPLEKAPEQPSELDLEFEFAEPGLAVDGSLGASRRFALRFARDGERFGLTEGVLRFGGGAPSLSGTPGLTVAGALPQLDLGPWLELVQSAHGSAAGELLSAVELEVAALTAFGQRLGSSRLDVARDSDRWRIGVTSERVAGSIEVPRGTRPARPQIVADMKRVVLADGAGADAASLDALDPRELPGLTVHADELVLGPRELGEVDLEIRPAPRGLRLVSFASRHGEMHIDATGSWLVRGNDGARTRLAVNLSSTQVASTLEKLGFDPVIEGELADVTASVEWPGAPSKDWLRNVHGDVTVRVETGSMLDIEPGAGRVVGLMSILALPRRLALDFRDVFNKGFVFDEITGDFLILDGDAYTDNLKLTGPAAEIGVAGRTGLADRDYEQQAVVTAEPGNMLPTVGGLIGGPGVGAALLIFTRIFSEPLKGIGRAVYCIGGSWDDPEVERLTAVELEQGRLCAALPPRGAAAEAGMEAIEP